MKTKLFCAAIALLIHAEASAKHHFLSASIIERAGVSTLHFSISAEASVRCYRIEAGADSTTMQLILVVPSRGSSMLPAAYRIVLAGGHQEYAYYRVRQVLMDYSELLSPLIKANGQPKPFPQTVPQPHIHHENSSVFTIATQRP